MLACVDSIANAREASKDVKVVEEERRVVNGTELLQVITYTAPNLFLEHRGSLEDFSNGFRVK